MLWLSMGTTLPAELEAPGWLHFPRFLEKNVLNNNITSKHIPFGRKKAVSLIKKVIQMALVESGQGIIFFV